MAYRQAVIDSIVEGFNERNIDKMTASASCAFVYQLLPKSLQRGPLSLAEFRSLFQATKPYFDNFRFEVVDKLEDGAANKTMVWANVTSDTPVGRFATETMHIFYFDSQGNIERWIEWVDSAAGKELERKMQEQ